jgi:hypothetical protein
MDFQYSAALNAFIEVRLHVYGGGTTRMFCVQLKSYVLYSTSTAGRSTKLINIPDGPGFPAYNTLSTDGLSFLYLDLAQGHIVRRLALPRCSLIKLQPVCFAG